MPRPWTVLKHDPLEKLQANLWTVEAALPQGPMRRRMGIARFPDGRLLFLNAVALDEPSMKEIEAWGTPAFALAGNGFHRIDLGAYRARYPGLKILAHPAASKRISEITPVDGWVELLPQDPTVRTEEIAGAYEAACCCAAGGQASLVFPGDLLANHAAIGGFGGFVGGALGFVGDLRVPRLMKWIGVKDKRALKEHLLRLADTPGLQRVLTCHGPVVAVDPAGALRRAAQGI